MKFSKTNSEQQIRSAIVLAGGEGMRLRPLASKISGDDRPKQFCALVGRETLLDRTRRRVSMLVPPDKTLLVLTRSHERFYLPLLAHMPQAIPAVQPENRDTAPAILYGLLKLEKRMPDALVAIFPSDHFMANDGGFMADVDAAFDAASQYPELVVVLGIGPGGPETSYGWIERGELIPASRPLFHINGFWEKPPGMVALSLWLRGGLWNSFVLVSRARALIDLMAEMLPGIYALFEGVQSLLDTPAEEAAIERIYSELLPVNFSKWVLTRSYSRFAVLPTRNVGWVDLGEPRRVLPLLVARTPKGPGRYSSLSNGTSLQKKVRS